MSQRRIATIATSLQAVVRPVEAAVETTTTTTALAAAKAAVVGNLVADAAAVTSHWVYDQNTLATHVKSLGGPSAAPFMAPINPFYHVQPGQMSCYGDQTWALVQAMRPGGGVDLPAYVKNLDTLMGGESDYGALGRVIGSDEMPIQGPWRHGSMKVRQGCRNLLRCNF